MENSTRTRSGTIHSDPKLQLATLAARLGGEQMGDEELGQNARWESGDGVVDWWNPVHRRRETLVSN